jgi:hypothetical protein
MNYKLLLILYLTMCNYNIILLLAGGKIKQMPTDVELVKASKYSYFFTLYIIVIMPIPDVYKRSYSVNF